MVVEESGGPFGLHAEEDVFGHGEIVGEDLLLKDHADAGLAGVVRAADLERVAGEADLARIHGVDAVENFHQRGFARAVFTDKRVDFVRPELQTDSGENAVPPERLGDAGHREKRFGHVYFRYCWMGGLSSSCTAGSFRFAAVTRVAPVSIRFSGVLPWILSTRLWTTM